MGYRRLVRGRGRAMVIKQKIETGPYVRRKLEILEERDE
jgi:hypothetical protein